MLVLLKKHSAGAHRFDFAITLTVISILATLLLNSLNRAQVSIEQMTRDAELNNINLHHSFSPLGELLYFFLLKRK